MKVIVTGGCGFIGSHLVDYLLKDGHEIIVLDNLSTGRTENIKHVINDIRLEVCDLSRKTSWETLCQGVDWVFHLASLSDIVPSIQQPKEYYDSNVTSTLHILEAARKYHCGRFVYAASSSSYGIPAVYPTPEDAPINPQYPYALTKAMGEELVIHWAKVYNLPTLSLRLFNVYGPRSRTSGTYGAMFGVFLAQKLAGKPYTVVGDGNQTRDFTYVTDVTNAFCMAAESNKNGKAYNIGSGSHVSVNRITEILGGKKVYIPKRPGEPYCTFADISKVKQEIGWTPKVSIEEGVGKLLENIDYWRNAPVWEPESIEVATREWFKYLW